MKDYRAILVLDTVTRMQQYQVSCKAELKALKPERGRAS